MEQERKSIQWNNFEERYFSPSQGEGYDVVIANWGEVTAEYEDGTKKPAIEADVLKINNEEYPIGTKLFRTSSVRFAKAFRPIAEAAAKEGKKATRIYLERTRDNRYIVRNLNWKTD